MTSQCEEISDVARARLLSRHRPGLRPAADHVTLVLLLLMILTLPTVLDKMAVDLPQGSAPPGETVTNPFALARDGVVTLDGVGVNDAAMLAPFVALKADPSARLVIRTDPEARYGRFDLMLAEVKRAGITRLGFLVDKAMVE